MPPRAVTPRLLCWASEIDDATLAQAERASRLPFIAGHVALMPDAHLGVGATVGSVIPTDGAVIPAAVGVDIGCGMVAVETSLGAADLPDSLDRVLPLVERRIPAGVGQGHSTVGAGAEQRLSELGAPATELTARQRATALAQFGTLGSGNHFVEVCLDERDRVWVVLHSGSRGIGNQLAKRHIEAAKGVMRRWLADLEDRELTYLTQGTPEFDAYITDMLWAQRYAFANRDRMMDAALASLFDVVGRGAEVERINCHHNFTQVERHDGRDVWITRKGAIKAADGDLGVIPGSMGTRSYVVRGRGSAASYDSCSHGAGRRLSRGRARRELSVEEFRDAMAGRAWQRKRAADLIDEAPAAYKDIDRVMADQADLVEVVHTLRQVLNYKGL